jgi:ribosomal-protein-alanine N-acetyltransferase
MIALLRKWLRPEASLGDATSRDAPAIARLHAQAFRRGWSDDEVEALLSDRAVMTHRATAGGKFVAFIMSRIAADEAEILSVAVADPWQRAGLAGRLLRQHLSRLAASGVKAVFLEVEDGNVPAIRLYRRAGFRQVGRREGYYQRQGGSAAALILRRDID